MFIKFCGFTRFEDLEFAVSLPITAVGFIFYKNSKRYIEPQKAINLINYAKEKGKLTVGIFVEKDSKLIEEIALFLKLDYLQLYFHKNIENLEKKFNIIYAYRINLYDDLKNIKIPKEKNLLLLDSFHKSEFGGTGKTFNWKLLKNLPYLNKTIIAGGINENNIQELLSLISPMGIDVSSGIEISPGIKSREKMSNLINKILEVKDHE